MLGDVPLHWDAHLANSQISSCRVSGQLSAGRLDRLHDHAFDDLGYITQ